MWPELYHRYSWSLLPPLSHAILPLDCRLQVNPFCCNCASCYNVFTGREVSQVVELCQLPVFHHGATATGPLQTYLSSEVRSLISSIRCIIVDIPC